MVERQVRIRSSSQALAGFARLTGFILAGILGMPMSADAQSFADLRAPDSPLVLQALGSFYVGGRTVSASTTAIGLYRGGPMLVDTPGTHEASHSDDSRGYPHRQDL
jgi:hypothetical protein